MRKGLLVLAVAAALLLGVAAVGGLQTVVHHFRDQRLIEQTLAQLQGRTGLDPLDPASPLRAAQLVTLGWRSPIATLRFAYVDGRSREYTMPVEQVWSLRRLAVTHRELPGLPPAGPNSALRLGTPALVPGTIGLHDYQVNLVWGVPPDRQALSWSPSGDAIVESAPDWAGRTPWLVPLDGRPAVRLPEPAADVRWTPDGRAVVYESATIASGPNLVLVDRAGRLVWRLPVGGSFVPAADGVLVVRDGALWRMPYTGAGSRDLVRLHDLPGWSPSAGAGLALAPDDATLAYPCSPDLCLLDLRHGEVRRLALSPGSLTSEAASMQLKSGANTTPTLDLAWSPDGRQIAISAFNSLLQPRLLVVGLDGHQHLALPVGPNGPLGVPQWTPDGALIVLQAYPEHGRRILAVDLTRQEVIDLTRPGWDPFGSLAPGGDRLALTDEQGSIWLAPVER